MKAIGKIFMGFAKSNPKSEYLPFALRLLGFDYIPEDEVTEDGGPGSGNWGHKGRPGKRGGSGKGGGKTMRSGSRSSGYTSFAKAPEFKGIAEKAKASTSSGAFLRSLSESERTALQAQHTASGTKEDWDSYLDRMHGMLVGRQKENSPRIKNLEKEFRDKKHDDDRRLGALTMKGRDPDTMSWYQFTHGFLVSPGKALNESQHLPELRKRFLDVAGKHAGWEKLKERNQFGRLDAQEKQDLRTLLERYPDESALTAKAKASRQTDSDASELSFYFDKLKAKALGIGGVGMIRPEAMDRLKPSSPVDGWEKRLSADEKERVDQILRDRTASEYLNEGISTRRKLDLLNIIGSKSGWNEQMLERQFDRLSEKEAKDLNFLLDQIPWGEGEKMSKVPNEALLDEMQKSVKDYYAVLKAKAMGLEGVNVPETPESVAYAMTHEPLKAQIARQNGGYVHTEAGNQARESIKRKMQEKAANDTIFKNMGTDMQPYRDAILASVDQMDDSVAALVEKTMDKAEAYWIKKDGTSFYDGEISIFTMNGDRPRDQQDIVSTFWHEYGHFLDDEDVSSAGFSFLKDPLRSDYPERGVTAAFRAERQYQESAAKDIDQLLRVAGLSDEYGTDVTHGGKVQLYKKGSGEFLDYGSSDTSEDIYKVQEAVGKALYDLLGYDRISNFMYEKGMPREPNYTDYFEIYTTPKLKLTRTRGKTPDAQDRYIEARKKYDEAKEKWIESLGGQEAYLKLLHQNDAERFKFFQMQKKLGGVTDCLDEAVNGLFGMGACWGGHAPSYYQRKGRPIETTANIFSIRAMNDPDVNSFMEKVIPNIASLVTKTWRIGQNEGKTDSSSSEK